ncbi:hypothetical protein K437DRAFT_45288 [Tilletiaria anomala UBC 951]|uniref:Uncharacterized protein n=1 Tax=Tilletiaria anomala (strain ATCC 24038 / CBS 436.72 / UBC 951) TaxID=1037660 RepID=A0A066WHK5_TILAU|nr:uncharacterized protein K437DRAFT_45288 [Tilletiaria anomala UBC 951]KDN51998.1 hypothetical protein K437DRAFT_45288 [Tilletiaria anomala UBC 951]
MVRRMRTGSAGAAARLHAPMLMQALSFSRPGQVLMQCCRWIAPVQRGRAQIGWTECELEENQYIETLKPWAEQKKRAKRNEKRMMMSTREGERNRRKSERRPSQVASLQPINHSLTSRVPRRTQLAISDHCQPAVTLRRLQRIRRRV